jgi:soluble lytic murein transglycosylase
MEKATLRGGLFLLEPRMPPGGTAGIGAGSTRRDANRGAFMTKRTLILMIMLTTSALALLFALLHTEVRTVDATHAAEVPAALSAPAPGADTSAHRAMGEARAAAGWGDWRRVEALLEGRSWLATHEGAAGLALLGRARLEQEKWAGARDALSAYLTAATDPAPADEGVARVRLAMALARLDEPAEALRAFDAAAARVPVIADWIAIHAARVAAEAGDTADVRRRFAAIGGDVAREWGWNARVRAASQAGDGAAAAAAAEAAARSLTAAGRRAEAWLEVARLQGPAGEPGLVRAALRNSIGAAAGSAAARDAARRFVELGGLTPADRLLVGRALLRHGDFQRGMAQLQAWIDGGHGTADEREALRLELGTALFNGRQFADAERILLPLARDAASRARRAEALFVAGRSQYRDGRTALGRQTFVRVSETYGDVSAGTVAAWFAADLLHDDDDIERASALYRAVVDSGRGIEEVGLAAMRLGGIAFQRGDFAAALREFEAYRQRFPDGRVIQQATFWAGRSLERLGNPAAARERFVETIRLDPLSYYAALASDAIGTPFFQIAMDASPPLRFRPEIDQAVTPVDLLRELGWNAFATWEIERVRSRFAGSDDALYTLAEALGQRGYTTTAISIGWDLRRRSEWNQRLLRIIYPFPYRDLVEREARARGVDPFLAAGLIRQESMFNAAAVSPVGAIGLMQVMPETGRAVAAGLGIGGFTPAMLYNPEVNVHIGMAYLADQIRSWGDRADAVLAAYNAGPHRVQRWRLFPEWSDPVLFAERIPFAETRGYVRIVQTNARIYRSLYDPQPAVRGSDAF